MQRVWRRVRPLREAGQHSARRMRGRVHAYLDAVVVWSGDGRRTSTEAGPRVHRVSKEWPIRAARGSEPRARRGPPARQNARCPSARECRLREDPFERQTRRSEYTQSRAPPERRLDLGLEDKLAIRELVQNWVLWRDAGDWERFRTVWHDDGYMMATWFQGPAED